LWSLPQAAIVTALILAPVLGRWTMAFLCGISNYARAEGGTGSPFIGQVKTAGILKAAIIAGIIAWATLQWTGLLLLGVATVFAWLFKRWVTKRINGMTGDTLGACSEFVEVLVFVLLSLHGPGFGR